jgi:pilus assembly protein TadC
MMPWVALLAGLTVAAGVWLLLDALRPSPPSLAVIPVDSRARPGLSVAERRRSEALTGRRGRAGRSDARRWSADPGSMGLYRDLAGDLRVVDYGVEYLMYSQIVTTIGGLVAPFILLVVILPAAGLVVPSAVSMLLCVALAAVGFYLPIHTLRQDAATRRSQFAAALSQYVSFVDVMVSGGNSIDASFEYAAELGDGWVWDELRFAITSAASATQAPYRALRELGDELGVVELSNLSRRLEQTQSTGAAIGPALRSLSDALAKDQARRVKILDDEVTEKMTFPLMIVLCSLLTFFGIAAVTAILRAAQGF